ncbi:MAG: 50S ribosomal protein L19 [Gemmatimonadetes bacterium]|jgi:large subunit ribosomal protein L19|nr:50S ribosomal protein L19 [Gemmatimonadota bacterium]MBT5329491.1 50S ribosomal protein L19 [Gemmatimonadota bacterium]MBT5450151.1 50S ribosomal protein L19 [Gemmatimonadota bacterium]MBT5800419.1 50S ribosomal protein L19 [Gemmatimonadota bacterium]MBT6623448.1 50S ribosomal protein L19 [Gemmatimonadota bacterium]
MDSSIMRELTSDQLKTDIPDFHSGDTVRVHVRVIEGEKERTQLFEGIVIQRKGGGIQETFTVRKITQGIAIERIFPVNSPRLAKIERLREGRVRRARLFYLRGRKGKSARIREKRR